MNSVGKAIFAAGCGLVLAGCSSTNLLPHESKTNAASFQTYQQVEQAYASVSPGIARITDLARLGFDPAGANAESLNHIGVSDRFMMPSQGPASHVPAQVQACIKMQDHCAAIVFHLQQLQSRHVGNVFLDVTGFRKNVVDTGWSADVLLVLQDGAVIYKIMSGRPQIEQTHDIVQPLGVLQNIAKTGQEPQDKTK